RLPLARPAAASDPQGGIEHDRAIAPAIDRGLGARHAVAAAPAEVALQRGELGAAAALLLQRLDALADQHVEIARRPELAEQPFELRLDARAFAVREKALEERERGAQPPQPDPHLM